MRNGTHAEFSLSRRDSCYEVNRGISPVRFSAADAGLWVMGGFAWRGSSRMPLKSRQLDRPNGVLGPHRAFYQRGSHRQELPVTRMHVLGFD
jgi:hypothetical protein